jgi:hypothetical protein
MEKTIIKVQRPIIGHYWLAYANGRVNATQFTPSKELRKAMKNEYKAFFEGEFENGAWTIGKRVKDREW